MTSEAIGHYRRKMERHPDEPQVLLHALNKLDRVQGVTIAVLQETRIGRAVNALKKHSDKRVASLAKHIVEKWKDIVKQEEEEEDGTNHHQHEETQENDESQDDDDNHRHSCEAENEGEEDQVNGDSAIVHEENNNIALQSGQVSDSEGGKGDRSEIHHEDDGKTEKEGSRSRDEERRRRRHKHKSERRREEKRSSSSGHRKKSSHRDHHKDDEESSKHSRKEKRKHQEKKDRGDGGDPFSEALNGLSTTLATSKTIQRQLTKNANLLAANSSLTKPSSSTLPLSSPSLSSSSLPDISPNYRPLRRKPDSPVRPKSHVRASDDEALSAVIAMKGKRTAIYSGVKRTGYGTGTVPTLREICIQVLIENVDSIEECGNLSFDVLEPVLQRASASTLARIEEFNPSLIMDTGKLWQRFVTKNFPKCDREEMESWREMYERCVRERDERLISLQASIMDSYEKEKSTHKKAKLAYVGVVPKAPRSAIRSQIRNGTGLPVGHEMSSSSRHTRPISTAPSLPTSSSSSNANAKKSRVAPLMSKTLKMARGMKSGFRR